MLRRIHLGYAIAALFALITVAVIAHQPVIYYAALALFLLSVLVLGAGSRRS